MSRGCVAERLYRQAHFDALTQLPNRLLFRDRLAQSVAAALSANSAGALLYIDLDHFKKINDVHGQAAGDHLLAIVAQRLRACVKDGDTVARLSGDEFAVILSQVSAPQAASAIAQRILESLQMPVSLNGLEHKISASVGISVFPNDGTGIDELLRNADMAMYRAKDRGRCSVVLFEPQMNNRQLRLQDVQLQSALTQREFALYYQPQFSLADGSLLAVEALLRWHSPRDGLRSPDDFVPAAEESGLIVDIGQWVLEAACSQFALWRLQGLPQPILSINVSQQQLRASGYASALRRMLEKYAFDPARLEIELPMAAFNDQHSHGSLQMLQRMNVRLALADLSVQDARTLSVRDFPIRTVKLARKFVGAMEHDAEVTQLAGQIITQSRALNRRVVAEGVETVSQMDLLREHGCDVVQGYYLARPLNVAGITELLSVRRPHTLQRDAAIA
jgi:diguanylate cyclase (GGDEF)-like protein